MRKRVILETDLQKMTVPVASKWSRFDSILIYNTSSTHPSPLLSNDQLPVRVAAFDLDHTIICLKSNGRHSINEHDWNFLYENVVSRMRGLHEQGYTVVIFTNQGGVGYDGRGKLMHIFQRKMESVFEALSLPAVCIAALDYDSHRKPNIGMWEHYRQQFLAECVIDYSKSFFVGDAAGRPKNWKPGALADHADVDRKFALNCGLSFYTPEEYFLGEAAVAYAQFEFDPREIVPVDRPSVLKAVGGPPALYVFVGAPCSGKTTYFNNTMVTHGIVAVRSAAASRQISAHLSNGVSVVVDIANPTRQLRSRYITIAKSAGVDVHCIYFDSSPALCLHLAAFRVIAHGGQYVDEAAILKFKRTLEIPSTCEGFASVHVVPFSPQFACEAHEATFRRFLF